MFSTIAAIRMSVIRTISSSLRKNLKSLTAKSVRCLSSNYILDSGYQDITIPKVSIPEYIFSKLEKFEKFTAIECGLTGRRYTYGELLKKSKNFSKNLRKKLGLKDGDIVAVLLPNIPEFPIAVLGALHANLVVTTLNPIYTKEEISKQLNDSSAKAIITIAELWESANGACQLLKKSLPTLMIKTEKSQSLPHQAINFEEFLENVDFPEIQPSKSENVAVLPYSSGTTGLPKGVELTNFNIVANICQNTSPMLQFIQDTTDEHQDVIPVILPMFHIYGFTVNTFTALCKGTKLITLPKFTPDDYVSVLRNHKPDILFLVPPIILFLSGHPMVKKQDLQSISVVFSGAAPLGALDEQRLVDKAGKNVQMLQGYGLTESSPTVCALTTQVKSEVEGSDGSIGRPFPNTLVKVIDIQDPNFKALGPNKQGELWVKGPQVMKGYFNKPEETKNTLIDGWLRTGDMVYYNDNKLLFVTDRLKELIKVKGFQVAPAELEEIIRDFPNVEDAAVIGIPHPILGEAPRAYIVGKSGTKVNTTDLEDYVKSKVASYKRLVGGVAIVESIPKNASGKIMRRTLKLDYEKNGK